MERGLDRDTWALVAGWQPDQLQRIQEEGVKECGHDEVIWLIRMRTKEREGGREEWSRISAPVVLH